MKIRATLRLRNDAMLAARKELGWSQPRLAQESGVRVNRVRELESLNYTHFECPESAVAIAAALELEVDVVMPEHLVGRGFESTHVAVSEMDPELLLENPPETTKYYLPAPEDELNTAEEKDLVHSYLTRLTYRERDVIKLWYGLDEDRHSCTLEEIGRIFHVTRERVRYVRDHALRKLSRWIKDDKKAVDHSQDPRADTPEVIDFIQTPERRKAKPLSYFPTLVK